MHKNQILIRTGLALTTLAFAFELTFQPIYQLMGRFCLAINCYHVEDMPLPKNYNSLLEVTRGNVLKIYERQFDTESVITDISSDQVSLFFIEALLWDKDRRYREHYGTDYATIVNSGLGTCMSYILGDNIVYGGSSIEEQLVRYLFEDPYHISLVSRFQRMTLASMLYQNFNDTYHENAREKILLAYLNSVDFGGVIGLSEAAQYYFNKRPSDLSPAESVLMVITLQAPALYNPRRSEQPDVAEDKNIRLLWDLYHADKLSLESTAQAQDYIIELFSFHLE